MRVPAIAIVLLLGRALRGGGAAAGFGWRRRALRLLRATGLTPISRDVLKREKQLSVLLQDSHVAGVLERYRVNCVLDVGANRGQSARRLRAAGYSGRIVSFEPVPHLFEALSAAAASDPHWSVHQIALGSHDGEAEMNVVPETASGWRGGLSSLLPPSAYGARRYRALKELSTRPVPVRRLDGLLDSVTIGLSELRLYVKLDTQGYDLIAFRGLGDRVADVVALQSELALVPLYGGAPTMAESLTLFEAAGFAVSGLFLISRERRTWRVIEYDCVMVRPEAA